MIVQPCALAISLYDMLFPEKQSDASHEGTEAEDKARRRRKRRKCLSSRLYLRTHEAFSRLEKVIADTRTSLDAIASALGDSLTTNRSAFDVSESMLNVATADSAKDESCAEGAGTLSGIVPSLLGSFACPCLSFNIEHETLRAAQCSRQTATVLTVFAIKFRFPERDRCRICLSIPYPWLPAPPQSSSGDVLLSSCHSVDETRKPFDLRMVEAGTASGYRAA